MKGSSALQLLLAAVASAANPWKNVNIGGGGGFVPGIIFHPTASGVAYARTDIGGLYRLNKDDSWTPITDSLATNEKWGNWGIDAVALDPQDPDKVYAATGMYTNSWDPNNGAIIRSSDQGATWESAELPFKVGGNMPGRGAGERLAVDPANSDILFFGARSGKGLWKSADGGKTWAQVESFENVGTYVPDPADTTGLNSDIIGLTFVTFDSTSDLLDGATSRIFVGTADNKTASLYVTEDAGATWTPVADQPPTFFPHKGRLQPDEKALYISYSDGLGPYDGTLGAVWRYDIAAGNWTDITPATGSDLFFGFGGLSVDLQKPGTLIVATLNSWWPDAQLYRSTDSGATWSKIWEWAAYPEQNWYYGLHTDNAPWINAGFISQDTKRLGWMIESLEIDPTDSDHWLYGTGLTLYGGHDLTKWDAADRNVSISSLAVGIEEFAVLGLASPVGGSELLAAVGDDSGFTFEADTDLGTSPQTPWMNPSWTSSTDVDYAGNKPANVVRVGNTAGTPQVAISEDGGVTWAVHPGADTSANSGTIAYSADGDTLVWSSGTSGVLRSADQATFAAVKSLPSAAAIAADRRNNTIFYAGSAASFYVSSDTGATFTEVASAFPSGVKTVKDIAAHPAVAGEVWVSTDAGVFRSTDFGATFTQADSSITSSEQIALGKGEGEDAWNVYVFGSGAEGAKLYGSADNGATWVDVQGEQGFGAIGSNKLAGSGNVAGQVYVGTNGRGVFVAQVSIGGGGDGGSTPTTLSTKVVPSATTGVSTSTVGPSQVPTTTAPVKCRK
ncbi:hypothetical protein B0J18DRAFT_266383 [Chaetomium sp. MPI-SDFR-AT-0129]|nr:hypothetical protein B0J18DRAFT_266383 [Chaetomium sp. MPI-SDFR-AT-0129]